jgi:outer membrane beta-barrel protein
LALSKKVLQNKGTITLRATDIFDTRRFQFETSGPTFYNSGYRKRESRNLYLSFTYRFGKLSAPKRRKRSNGNGGSEMEGGPM